MRDNHQENENAIEDTFATVFGQHGREMSLERAAYHGSKQTAFCTLLPSAPSGQAPSCEAAVHGGRMSYF